MYTTIFVPWTFQMNSGAMQIKTKIKIANMLANLKYLDYKG